MVMNALRSVTRIGSRMFSTTGVALLAPSGNGSLSRPIAGRRRVDTRPPWGQTVLSSRTYANDELLKTIALADAEEERFPAVDGTEIQAFVYKPRSFDPEVRYPTLLWLHGGQESQYDYGFNFRAPARRRPR